MHRFRSWTLDPPEWRTQRNRLLPAEGGDGSTLSLDFTTGMLDPRLTFTRGTNATFINSQGYVQYADANLIQQSESLQTSPWSAQGGTVQVLDVDTTNPIGGPTSTRLTAGNANGAVLQVPTITSGVPHTIRFWVRAGTATRIDVGYFSGGFQTGTCSVVSGGTATIVGSTLFSITNLTTTWTLIQIVLTAPVSGGSLLFYPDTAGSPTSGTTLFMWGVQMNAGTTASQYYRTTTTVYQAPRFDYDPTTTPPTPRGLLIEGGANSLVARSQALNQSAWLKTAATSISETGTGSPANDATSNVLTWTNGTAVGNAYTEQSGLPVSGGQPYTWSVWLKNRGNRRVSVFGFTKTSANAFSGNLEMTVDFSVATPTASITVSTNFTSTSVTPPVAFGNGWYRCTMTGTTPSNAAVTGFGISNKDAVPASGTNGCEVWGAQLEAGSGASSYIPTGANQGSRTKDICNITGSNFSSWFVDGPGTIVAQSDNVKFNTRNLLCEFNKDASNYIQMGVGAGAGSGEALFYNPNGFSQSGTTPSLNTAYKSAYVWDTDYFKMCLNGTLGSADTNGNIVSSGMVNLSIGGDLTNPTDVYIKNGHIRSLKYWPTRLPDAQLQALTTG